MASWLSSLSRILFQPRRPPVNSVSLPPELTELLPDRRASTLRLVLRERLSGGQAFSVELLMEAARAHEWTDAEMAKLLAYTEFFSGQSANAYSRVMRDGLASRDYDLLMTACVHCYLHDRLAEGYALLQQFKSDEAGGCNYSEFFAYAGYLTFVGGGSAEAAAAYFDKAVDQGLFSPMLATNAYPIYFELGHHERVDQLRRLIHENCADDQEAVYAVACVELARDFYPEGFRLAEARYHMPEVARSINPTLLSKPRWQGESLSGRRLLVHGEQGFGDIVMMSRYLKLLCAQGVHVILDCREAALSLLAYNFPNCTIVAGDLRSPLNVDFDVWTGIMSLPFHFSTTAATVPATAGYLMVPPDAGAYWQDRVGHHISGKGPKIGIAWSGNPAHRADRRRSIPFDSVSAYLREYPDVQFYALQTTVPEIHPGNLSNLSEELVTLADTAALIAEMDLVITVDTSIVHIAGALGKPTWLLLPYRYEWRWGLTGEQNNWYDAVQVLRQTSTGDWDGVLAGVFRHRLPEFVRAFKEEGLRSI